MIELTDRAKEYLEKVGKPNVSLTVKGGGCSGFQYGFTFEQKANDADWKIIANNGVTLLIDPISMQYLKGSTIDYEDNVLKGAAFIIKNPNAKIIVKIPKYGKYFLFNLYPK